MPIPNCPWAVPFFLRMSSCSVEFSRGLFTVIDYAGEHYILTEEQMATFFKSPPQGAYEERRDKYYQSWRMSQITDINKDPGEKMLTFDEWATWMRETEHLRDTPPASSRTAPTLSLSDLKL